MSDTGKSRFAWLMFANLVMALLGNGWAARAAADEKQLEADKRSLAPLQSYVGGWRGVGQLRRGSSQGAWTEQADWEWQFADGRATIVGTIDDGKYFSRLQLQAGDEPGHFVLLATPATAGGDDAASEPRRFTGSLQDGMLVLSSATAAEDQPARVTMRLVAGGDRMVVLYQKRLGESTYARLAEVGSTRKGSSFAKLAAAGPECVVTGGLGTIAVEYQGKTYYVCCGGCRDLFNDDPAGVLEDYRQRKAAEKAERDKPTDE